MIYFDNAATTLQKPEGVEKAVSEALRSAGNAGRGIHAPTLFSARMIYDTREKLAKLFGMEDASRIAFTANATEALNLAIRGLSASGGHIITTECEHNSVLRPLYLLEKEGTELTILKADRQGKLDYQDFEKNCRENTRAVVITHASNLTGNVTDIKRVSEFTKRHGILLVVDASQTAGTYPIDVQELGIDVLCFTGHKGLFGPQGTGGIYVREGVTLSQFKVGGSGVFSYDKKHPSVMPEALEAGTLNAHGIAGLNAALSCIEEIGVEEIHRRELLLAKRFADGVRDLDGVQLYGDLESENRVGIVSLNIGEMDSGAVSDYLWEKYEIAVRAGAHCAPLMHEALGTKAQGAVRFSFSIFNTEEEVDIAIRAIRDLL